MWKIERGNVCLELLLKVKLKEITNCKRRNNKNALQP